MRVLLFSAIAIFAPSLQPSKLLIGQYPTSPGYEYCFTLQTHFELNLNLTLTTIIQTYAQS
ncbi:MAG: hypothetical protein CM15mP22_4630 [Gammaproteobacteria bacterium]|nr:MAG: hypothetical protein CM15mP22_4630 [Gammaproteobacteria bacterium]